MSVDLTRRDFLWTCGVLAASLSASAAVGSGTRVAALLTADPALEDYRPALRALIETVLSRDFPLDAKSVEQRLLRMFPLEDERRFLGFQRTLVYFDALDLAPHVAAPLVAAERIALDVPARSSEGEFRRTIAAKTETESRSCKAFVQRFGAAPRFISLPREGRTEWLQLWSASEFAVKRDFARSVRTLTYVAAYSSDRVWPAIGYDGTLLDRRERSS